MKIYLAGKISKLDWRHEIVGHRLRGANGHGDWQDEEIRFGNHVYTGPFFTGCDHGCSHSLGEHGISGSVLGPACEGNRGRWEDAGDRRMRSAGQDIASGESNDFIDSRKWLRHKCIMAIARSDLVFAWLDDPSAHGTMWELGYASGLGIETCIGIPADFDASDLWFPVYGADSVYRAETAKEALGYVLKLSEDKSESPIESQMLGAFQAMLPRGVRLEQQHQTCGYRLDFALFCGPRKIAVECDGHAYHEKTKEQARRDKSRDRTLVENGWTVLRFTGSEIHKDVIACARQAIRVATQTQVEARA